MAAPAVLDALRALGSPEPKVRSGLPSKAGECVTDNGMWLIDAPFSPLLLPGELDGATKGDGAGGRWEIDTLAAAIKRIPGVCEIGLFWGVDGAQAAASGRDGYAEKPVAAYFGMEDGSVSTRLSKTAT